MKLHELKQAYNELARNMRNLHDKIGDTTWTDEQRSQWSDWKQKLDDDKRLFTQQTQQ